MNWMVLPNQVCLIVKLYNNRPGLLPDSNVSIKKKKKIPLYKYIKKRPSLSGTVNHLSVNKNNNGTTLEMSRPRYGE